MAIRQRYLFILLLSLLLNLSCATKNAKPEEQNLEYLGLRKSYKTILETRGPAPQQWRDQKLPPGVKEVSFNSGNLRLRAWLVLPTGTRSEKVPAVVYFHGGFAFSVDELRDCQPFLDAGFAVLAPTLRGENGNPGNFELLYGEVEDARAATLWLANQPNVDTGRIYTFGHSVGGGISALLSLWDDVPIRLGGSSGGLYPQDVFYGWNEFAPFDISNETERRLRLLVGNIAYMKRRHIAYIGRKDSLVEVVKTAESEAKQSGAPLDIKVIEGDHFTSLRPAVMAFAELIRADK